MEKDIPISPAPLKELNCAADMDLSGLESALEMLKVSFQTLSVTCLSLNWPINTMQ